MPTYSYRCADCGHEYDAFQNMRENPHTECPQCKGRVERLIGAGAGILFKGSGFYVTDYRSGNGSGGGGKTSGGGKSSDGGEQKGESGSTSSSESGGKDVGSKSAGNTGNS